ncbi:MAG: phospho-N-acetylmuramoyl-pentapeptide-transferase [Agathobacter sp.]|uniref:phospho-N-acetylmuramoyl-pentapeptide- transferase n=1 Tax=Agathobacter sp. TaxID=2021311 RepID=UPI0025843C84|nr:phospho-N-acetylmuramoyl-pentapeptide-transferase [Agathobacter sp.]MCR5677627.1 phospho-N-acetylmuramoyl-pentapeptide-transferase [Agathobacter sp.]
MLYLIDGLSHQIIALLGVIIAFFGTVLLTMALKDKLPRDQGRAFAVEGAKSAGKPRGAGIIFVFVFAISALLCCDFSLELVLYVLLVVVEMFTGYFDDAAEKPWNEYLKGVLDLAVAVATAVVYLHYNDSSIVFALFGNTSVEIPAILYGLLTVVLVWAAINVTNCSDGVDGLSGSVSIVTMMSFYALTKMAGNDDPFLFTAVLFALCLLGYLWFNATPSLLLMGDAGSRAMGFFLAVLAIKSKSPVMFLVYAIVLILDGGLGLVKVSLLRFLKIHILKNTLTPLHDNVRKKKEWSNAQVTIRFTILQLAVSVIALYIYRL